MLICMEEEISVSAFDSSKKKVRIKDPAPETWICRTRENWKFQFSCRWLRDTAKEARSGFEKDKLVGEEEILLKLINY